jgi:hypothetical protein
MMSACKFVLSSFTSSSNLCIAFTRAIDTRLLFSKSSTFSTDLLPTTRCEGITDDLGSDDCDDDDDDDGADGDIIASGDPTGSDEAGGTPPSSHQQAKTRMTVMMKRLSVASLSLATTADQMTMTMTTKMKIEHDDWDILLRYCASEICSSLQCLRMYLRLHSHLHAHCLHSQPKKKHEWKSAQHRPLLTGRLGLLADRRT